MTKIQCIRCIYRKTQPCKDYRKKSDDRDGIQVRECEKFIPRTEETGFNN
jgi:hypothetical protein